MPVIAPDEAGGPEAHPPLRICVVAPSLDILGGQAVHADRLIARLRAVPGVTVELLPVNPRLPGPLRILQRVKLVRTVVTSIAYVATLLARLPRYDVVHAFSASYFSYLLAPLPALLVARLYGKPVILNYHSGEAEDHLRRWPLSRRTMRLATRIIVPSRWLVEVFARFGLRAEAVFNHVDAEGIPWRARSAPRPLFLSNRNMEPHYNVGLVIRAFASVQRRHPDALLLVAGDGPQRRALEALARELGLAGVEFLGQVSPESMGALYDRCDVYLNGSDVDNMPLSILEAFAAGLPVVTTDAGGIPHLVADGETGLLVPRGDQERLAAAALRVLDEDGLASRLADRARQELLDRYTWPAVGPAWLRHYRELAGA